MSEEAPKLLVIDGITANNRVTYTQSHMLVEHKINSVGYIGLIIAAVIVFAVSLQFHDTSCSFVGLLFAVLLILGPIGERSYRYEFDKEKGQITCIWGGFLGISVHKNNVVKYHLSDVIYVRLYQIPGRGQDSFKVKILLRNRKELDLPSGHSLGSSLEYANLYRDFFELETPIETVSRIF